MGYSVRQMAFDRNIGCDDLGYVLGENFKVDDAASTFESRLAGMRSKFLCGMMSQKTTYQYNNKKRTL